VLFSKHKVECQQCCAAGHLRAHRSLMIVRAYQPVTADLTGLRYRKIFLRLDGSQRAEMSLTFADSLARAAHSGIATVPAKPLTEVRRKSPPEDG